MRIYLRKVFDHDVTHEVSVRRDVAEDFFGGYPKDISFYKKDQLNHRYSVDINESTDPRFGGRFKELLRDCGDIKIDDIIFIRKFDNYFDLEIIRPNDNRYATYFNLFPNGRSADGRDRHQVFTIDESGDNDDSRKVGASNILLYGVPGVGKSFEIRTHYLKDALENEIERVVFHPDYTYSDFVGQILPRLKKNAAGEEKLEYAFVPGPFTKMLKKAEADPKHYYYLIIEEINRGNAPAIFGEVFQLMDRKDSDKYSANVVGESEYGITNFDVAKEVYGDEEHEIRIPSNMYIIATMNTADQNVFTLDTAFQRRWCMRHIKNDVFAASHAKVKIQGTNVSWGQFAYVINNLVVEVNSEVAASEDKRLGAYFAKQNELVPDKFSEKVLKYLWDDAFKLNREEVFKPDYKSLDVVIENYERTSEDRLKAILRSAVYEKMIASSIAENESDDNTTPNE